MQYTWPQYQAFVRAAMRQRAARQFDLLNVFAIASRGDGDALASAQAHYESFL